jgi:hypothetical protein
MAAVRSAHCALTALPAATGMMGGMGHTGLRPWRDGWAGQLLGRPGVLCDLNDIPAEGVASGSRITEPEAGVPFTYVELQAFETVTPFLRPNPRHLKRLINVYRLVRALARSKDEDLLLSNPAATIRWLVMWSQWPYTAHAMLERHDELLDQWGGRIGDDVPKGEPLLYLLEAVTPQLDREPAIGLTMNPGRFAIC